MKYTLNCVSWNSLKEMFPSVSSPLGIEIDSNLIFKEYIKSLCKKSFQKINALSRFASSMYFNRGDLQWFFVTFQIAQLCEFITAEI